MANFFVQLEIDALQEVDKEIKANAAAIEALAAPYIAEGEAAAVAALSKFNPLLGAIVGAAINELGNEAPKLEGDAVAYLEAVIAALVKKLQAG